MKHKIELIETRQGCECCETTPRYNVMLNGVKVDQLWWNIHGYVGTLPTPDGHKLHIGERSISQYRRAATQLMREARKLEASE